MKYCKNCNQELDKPVKKAEEKLQAITIETGKHIYYAILDKKFRSMDLCNWCYSIMEAYRQSLKPHKKVTEQEVLRIKAIIGK